LPSSPAERFGLDSNVLVYLVDDRDRARQQRAREIIDLSARSRRCVLSTQNLGEFFNVATRKGIVAAEDAQQKAYEFMALFEVASPDVEDVRWAMIERIAGRLQFWDAHLLATLGRAGCSVLLSEDMADGARLGALTVRNPFGGTELPDDLAQLLAR
jgi:predicted nucleic acid-binding protein